MKQENSQAGPVHGPGQECTWKRYLDSETALAAASRNRERNYWLENLAGVSAGCSIPYDLAPIIDEPGHAGTVGYRPEAEKVVITGDLFTRIMQLSNNSDPRLQMILVTALFILFYKHSGKRDVIIGMPVFKQAAKDDLINRVLALRTFIDSSTSFKELLVQVRELVHEAVKHQDYPLELLVEPLGLEYQDDTFPLFDSALLLDNIQDKAYLEHLQLSLVFVCQRKENSLEVTLEYDAFKYSQQAAKDILARYLHLLEVVYEIDCPISRIPILPAAEVEKLASFATGPQGDYPREKTIPQLIAEQAEAHPNQAAISCGDRSYTFTELDEQARLLALYLKKNGVPVESPIGILMDRSIDTAAAVLATWYAGCAYIPLDTKLPEKPLARMLNDARTPVVLSQKKYIKLLNRLQWSCPALHTFLCIDSNDIYAEEEAEKSRLMDPELWEYVAETAEDDIMEGGWISSYTGEHFNRQVVEEFAENLYQKLSPILHEKLRVLEIGTASGMSMYRIAPHVGYYHGTDISRVIIARNRQRVQERGIENIEFSSLAAHEIGQVEGDPFDLIIINSVIQDFHGHNYLRQVIKECVACLPQEGKAYIFVGDVMDQDLKAAMIEDLLAFKRSNAGKDYKTKTEWDAEFFVSKGFFEDLAIEIPGISRVEFSEKIYTVENELTKFRYDVLIHVERNLAKEEQKENPCLVMVTDVQPGKPKNKYQHDARVFEKLGRIENLELTETLGGPGALAYVIYTSGSTGMPKGAMVEHAGMMNHMQAKIRDLGITENSKIVQNASFAFDISVWQFLAAIVMGGQTLVYTDEVVHDPLQFLENIAADRVTILEVVPSYLSLLLDVLDSKPIVFDDLEYLLVTGEAVSPALVKRWFAKYPAIKMVNAYGPTEVSDDITHHIATQAPPADLARFPIGKPIQDLSIFIVDEDMNPCPAGMKGEICVTGIGVGRGYLNRPEITAERFVASGGQGALFKKIAPWTPTKNPVQPLCGSSRRLFYKTGDIGCWLPDGSIDFFGRKDYQVKIRGYRIELGEIENKLVQLPGVKEAVVVEAGEAGNNYLCAYVVMEEIDGEEERVDRVEGLKVALEDKLSAYMIPKYIVGMESFPLSANGKIDRKRLPPPDVTTGENYVPPANEEEEQLVSILADVLRLDAKKISVSGDFFELGANSITILNIQNRINESFKTDISLSLLFMFPNVRDLVKNIHEVKLLNSLECIIKLNNGRNKKNIFIFHPLHGMVYQYKELADRLKDHYNVYGVQSRGLLTSNWMPNDMDSMVADYIEQVKTIQPKGPYIFAGFCIGCIVGYEVTKQFELNKERIEKFFILDEPAFVPYDKIKYLYWLDRLRPLFHHWQKRLKQSRFKKYLGSLQAGSGSPSDPGGRDTAPQYDEGMRRAESIFMKDGDVPMDEVEKLQTKRQLTEEHIKQEMKLKVSGIIDTSIGVIKVEDPQGRIFDIDHYRRLTRGEVRMETVSGDHNAMLFPPHVDEVAKWMLDMLHVV